MSIGTTHTHFPDTLLLVHSIASSLKIVQRPMTIVGKFTNGMGAAWPI